MRKNIVWSRFVRWTTVIAGLILIAASLNLIRAGWVGLIGLTAIVAVVVYAARLAPMSLEVTNTELSVHCLLGMSRISLSEIVSVEPYIPGGATVRLCGSGGFMGYTGLFYRKDIGRFHAYVGAWRQAFLVTTRSGKRYVLSCEGRDEMVALLREHVA